ncbi:MAG: putative Ig domain-containing protein [Planctomycetota bacterium]
MGRNRACRVGMHTYLLGLILLAGCELRDEIRDLTNSESQSSSREIAFEGGDSPTSFEPAAPAELTLETSQLAVGLRGIRARRVLRAVGGSSPYVFELTGGALPEGLSMDASRGVIEGTAASAGRYRFTIQVTDSSEPPETRQAEFSMVIVEPGVDVLAIPDAETTAANAAAGLGMVPGLHLTAVRGAGAGVERRLDWTRLDYSAPMAVARVEGAFEESELKTTDLLTEKLAAARSPVADLAVVLDGWVWVEEDGDLSLTLAEVDDGGLLWFDGKPVASRNVSPESPAGSAVIPGVKRGLHRIKYHHYNASGGYRFSVLMAEGGTKDYAVIGANRLFCGPAIDELPMLEHCAVEGRPYEHKLKTLGLTGSATFSLVDGKLPDGISLREDGRLEGSATVSGTHYFTLSMQNGAGVKSLRSFALHVFTGFPFESQNTPEQFLLTFDGGMDDAPGITIASEPDANDYTLLGAGAMGLKAYINKGLASGITDEVASLGSGRSYFVTSPWLGFYITGGQSEHMSNYFPAARTANRFGVFFRAPASVDLGERGQFDWREDPTQYRQRVLSNVHIAGHNVFRWQSHKKEQNNWHFYHINSLYWPDTFKTASIRYVGDGWYYYEACDLNSSQRTGATNVVGLYNPIRDSGRNYFDTLSRVYFQESRSFRNIPTETGHVTHYDNIRIFRRPNLVRVTTRDGKGVHRGAIGVNAKEVEIPFVVENVRDYAVRFRIARYLRKTPRFDGESIFVDANGNGKVDAGEPELKGKQLTESFAPGESRTYVYVVRPDEEVDVTHLEGVTFRVQDPRDVFSLDGDSLMILLYRSANPSGVNLKNLRSYTTGASNPSPTGATNRVPEVSVTQGEMTVRVGQEVPFEGTVSDEDGPRGTRPYWDFGDGTALQFGLATTHVFSRPGVFKVRLYASDSFHRGHAEITVTVTP